jgi:hypothetical protein
VLALLVEAGPLAFAAVLLVEGGLLALVAAVPDLSCDEPLFDELLEPEPSAELLALPWSIEKIWLLEEFAELERVALEDDELDELLLILSATSHLSISPRMQ